MTRINEEEQNKEEEIVVGNNFLSMFMAVAYCLRAITKSHARTTHTLHGKIALAFYHNTGKRCYGSQYSLLYLEL